MCLTIPGKVIEIKDNEAVIDYNGEKRTAISFFKINKGDSVIVSQGIVIKILK